MDGIVISIDPTIAHLGPFEIRWYGLAIMVGVLVAVLLTAHRAKKVGIAQDHIYNLAIWVIVGGIVGARLFHVIDRFSDYVANPGAIFAFQQGGLAIWGALAGGAIAALVYTRLKHIPMLRFFDAVTPGLLMAQMIGRIGCIINGDAYGGVTSLPWAFIYKHPNAAIPADLFGVPTHPYPVYEMLWNGLVLLIIWQVGKRFKLEGATFLSYLSLYALGRFVLTFVRQETIIMFGLQQAQMVALAVLVGALVGWGLLLSRSHSRQLEEPGS